MNEMTKQVWARFVLSANEALSAIDGEHPEFAEWVKQVVDQRVSETKKRVQTHGQKRLNEEKALVEIVSGSVALPDSTPKEFIEYAGTFRTVFTDKLERNLYAYNDPTLKNLPPPKNPGDFKKASFADIAEGWIVEHILDK